MKVLVDASDGKVQGAYASPLNFSMSGRFAIDVPDFLGPVPVRSDVLTDIINAKNAAFLAIHPSMSQILADEFLDTSQVTPAFSSGVIVAPGKGVVIMPGGQLVTTTQSITVPMLERVLFHWYGFTLGKPPQSGTNQPPPAPMLYNYDATVPGFVEFSPGTFTVDMVDPTLATTLLGNVAPDTEISFSATTPLSFRLRFTNVGSVPYHISDWIVLAG